MAKVTMEDTSSGFPGRSWPPRMANAPQGPRECGAPTEDEHHERPHGEEGDHTAQEVGAPRALCHVGGEVPLGFGTAGPRR